MYFLLKFLMIFNFLLTVYLATQFRVGLGMFTLLFIELQYFWKSHMNFIEEVVKQNLDNKILKRKLTLIKGLNYFYKAFISKKGVVEGNSDKLTSLVGSDLERQLTKFTFTIRYDDIKTRAKFYTTLPLAISIILILCYVSKFVKMLEN